MVSKELTAFRKTFLYEKAHSCNLRARLTTKIDDRAGSVTIRQEIINEQDAVFVRQEPAIDTHGRLIVSRKRPHPRFPRVINRLRDFLLHKHHRQVHNIAQEDRRSYTGCLNGNDLIDTLTFKQTCELLRTMHHQLGV